MPERLLVHRMEKVTMAEQERADEVLVGIDVGKDFLDVMCTGDGAPSRCRNDEEGIGRLVSQLCDRAPSLVVMEASGGYQRRLLIALVEAGIAAVAVNPRQVRDFAKAVGLLEKTDAIDARMLLLFAERMRPEVRALPDETTRLLEELLGRRRQMVEMLVSEKNRLHQALSSRVRKDIEAHIVWLKKRIKDNDEELGRQVESSPSWNAKVQLLDDLKGVGRLTALMLLASVPELGTLDRKKIAKLVGVAPLACDSGRHSGHRRTWGGRSAARLALYMATLVATKHNATIRTFYQRLIAAGKAKKVALVACMRKLLIITNAMLRTHLEGQRPALA